MINRLLSGETERKGGAEGGLFVDYSTADYRIIHSVAGNFTKPAEAFYGGDEKQYKTKRPDFSRGALLI